MSAHEAAKKYEEEQAWSKEAVNRPEANGKKNAAGDGYSAGHREHARAIDGWLIRDL